MKKVVVIGSGGAGKSTFSRQLGEILNLPVHHLDTYFWKPGWVQTPNDEWDRFVQQLVLNDKWIIDGNYSRTFEYRFKEADTIIYLDMPRYLTIYRIIKRRIMFHGRTRPDMNEGCNEKLDLEFLKWVWNFNKKRPKILKRLSEFSKETNIFILKSPLEVKEFLQSIKNNSESVTL